VIPPSTQIICPVMNSNAGETGDRTACVRSRGSAMRLALTTENAILPAYYDVVLPIPEI
jgi:hypothetical protein